MSGLAHRLRRDERGVALLELGLMAPFMAAFLVGVTELSYAVRIQSKLNAAAGALAQFVAANPGATTPGGSLADACIGAAFGLLPFRSTTLAANIVSVTVDHPSNRVVNGSTTAVQAYLDWEDKVSCPSAATSAVGLTAAFNAANAPVSMFTKAGTQATGVTDPALQLGSSAVVVTLTYVYTSVSPVALAASYTLTATAVARPRSNVAILCTPLSGGTKCPVS